jgi:hypothetical protein
MPTDFNPPDIPVKQPEPVPELGGDTLEIVRRGQIVAPEQPQTPETDPGLLAESATGLWLGLLNTGDAAFGWAFPREYETVPHLDESGKLRVVKTNDFAKQLPQSKTITGGLVRGVSEFAIGAASVGGAVSSVTKAGGLAMSIAKGAAADYVAFGAHEERLSNVVADLGVPIASTIAEHLKAEESDGEVAGRLKNVIEGGILGITLEAGFKLIGGVAKLRKAKQITGSDPDKAKELIAEATADLAEVKPHGMVLAPTKPIQATAKDRIIAKTLEVDPALTHSEADALADIQISLARYVNPAQEADVTLASIMDVTKVRAEDLALRQVAERIVAQDPSKSLDEAMELAKAQAAAVPPTVKPGGPRGKTTFASNGKALVELFDKADLTTHLHETAHVFRRYLRPDDKAVFESWLGVKDGKWTRAAEERFAVGFEEYMRRGEAPTEQLKGAFERIKAVVVDVYKKLRGHGKGLARLSPEVKQAYDRLLSNTEREGIFDTRVNMAAKQLSNDLGITVRPTHVRGLAEAVKKGGKIDYKLLEIPHFTRILRAAHESQGSAELAQQVFKEVNDLNPTGVQSLVDTARIAQSIGQDKEALVSTMRQFVQNNQQLNSVLAAYDWHVQMQTAEVAKLAAEVKKYGAGDLPERLSAQFLQRHSELTELVELQLYGQTIVSRSMGAYRLRGQPIDAVHKLFQDGDKQIDELFQSEGAKVSDMVGGPKSVLDLADKVLEAKGAEDAAKRMKDAGKTMHAAMNKIMEWYMNAILSGPKTHLVNMVSNTVMTVMVPLERIIGGKVLSAFGKKQGVLEAKKGVSQLMGLQMAFREALQAGKESWSSGSSFMEKATAMDVVKGTQSKFLKSYVYVAGRALQAEDSFFKVLSFRAHAYAELVEKAGKEANPEAFIKTELDKMMKDPLAYGSSANAAKTATFTHDLKPGTSFHSLSSFVNRHPWARIIVPFVKTPSNILLEFGRHVPGLPLLRKGIREAIVGKMGAEAQASFIGKQVVGFGLATTAFGLYQAGFLTGSGPTDPEERKAWLAAGNREYAINVGGRWWDYKRMDPWATLLGTMADTSKACTKLGKPEEAVNIMFKGIKQGVVDKTYFKGISDIVKALDNPEVFGVMWASNVSSGMLPYSGAMSQASRAITSHSYRMNGFLDAFRAKSMGIWEPEKRYDLYGNPIDTGIDEAVSPFASTADGDSPALAELASIKGGIDMEPPKVIGNVQLTKEQREFIAEQTGKVKIGGQTLMERLESIVASESYQKLPSNDLTPDDYTKVPRAMALKRPFDAAQAAAIRMAKEKFPELKQAINQDRLNKALVRAGEFDRVMEISK